MLRKILLIFTDGVPSSMDKARLALADAKALGVETYALSYRCEDVKSLFAAGNCRVISEVEELPQALAIMLLGAVCQAVAN